MVLYQHQETNGVDYHMDYGSRLPTGKVIVSLCDYSGSWPKFYREAGYDVRCFDLKTTGDIRLLEYLDCDHVTILDLKEQYFQFFLTRSAMPERYIRAYLERICYKKSKKIFLFFLIFLSSFCYFLVGLSVFLAKFHNNSIFRE